jgi:hypothetical protein
MSTYIIEPAAENDNEALCALCSIPMKGNISLSFKRSPNFFAGSAIQCEKTEVYVCRRKDDHHIYGVFSVGKRRVFYQNIVQDLRYFSDLRIHPNVQGARVLYQITRYITDHNLLEGSFAQTIVFADNTLMLKLIESLNQRAGNLSIFKYYPAGNYNSYMVKFSRFKVQNHGDVTVRKANENDIESMNEFIQSNGGTKNFFPFYDFSQLDTPYYKGLSIDKFYLAIANGEIIGIAGVWDQKAIKQTKIHAYSKLYKSVRPLVNVSTFITGGLKLPSPGTTLNYLAVHAVIVKDNDPIILKKLLQTISNDFVKAGYDYFLIGFDEKDKLNEALSIFKHKRIIKGKHFLVSNKEITDTETLSSPYYLETARI